eukprot:jgi/Phyca11/533673/estExt2_fgenesh1_pg.C_PHYCAscaffold_160046
MSGLYAKSFIFGSYEREVSCTNNQDDDDDDHDHDEQLSVKTKSFSRTTILGHNEQWCYSDYFQQEEMEQCRIAKRKNSHRKSVEIISSFSSSSSSSKRSSSFDGDSTKAQLRRLLDMAHGVTKLPDLSAGVPNTWSVLQAE